MHRILAIDYGTKRIGLAISDPLRITAQPLTKLENNKTIYSELSEIIKEKQINKIVLGNPIRLDGTDGPASQNVQKFAAELQTKFPDVKIILWDERMTTAEAQKRMIEADVSRKNRKENIDKIAATLLLQSYLDSQG